MKNLEEIPRPDIIESLEEDKSKFLGTFDYNKYQITRTYLSAEGVQIKLYY